MHQAPFQFFREQNKIILQGLLLQNCANESKDYISQLSPFTLPKKSQARFVKHFLNAYFLGDT
jgi:hypothetical protein